MIAKKNLIILSGVLLLISAVASYYFFGYFSKSKASIEDYQSSLSQEVDGELNGGPKTEECPLNGRKYTKAQRNLWGKRRPMGIMIENHLEARPQSGLTNADVIYEAVAEGGITRFLAMYYCLDSKTVGPVRSARIYYLTLLQGYGRHPLYAHVGGANTPGPADALGEIRDLGWDGYNDMNQFAVPYPYYYRDYERLPNRATEHTMYASTSKLWKYAKKERKLSNKDKKGTSWDKGFTPWQFKDDASVSNRGSVAKISFPFWSQFGGDYSAAWTYDKEKNVYSRTNGGNPFVDKNTGKTLTTKSIVIVFADESPANDGYPGGHLLYDLIGSGEGLIFQDGKSAKITWKKPKATDMMRFFDASGDEVQLVRGQIFVEILPTGNKVTY